MTESHEKRVSVFGLLISRRTDVLALAAFLISIITSITAFGFWLRGAEIVMLPLKSAAVFANRCYNESDLEFVLSPVLINKGAQNYSGIVTDINAKIIVGNREYKFTATNVVEFELFDKASCSHGTISMGSGFRFVSKGSFEPIVLNGGQSTGKQYLFDYVDQICLGGHKCSKKEKRVQFIDFVRSGKGDGHREILVEAVQFDNEVIVRKCTIGIMNGKILQQAEAGQFLNLSCKG